MRIFLGRQPVKLGLAGSFYDLRALNISTSDFATEAQMRNVILSKTASAGGSITAHPGGRTYYSINVTNNNDKPISVNVEDTIPDGMSFISGCANVRDNKLYWTLNNIAPGATSTITYKVRPDYTIDQVRAASSDIVIKNTEATVQNVVVPAPEKDIYILETFNSTDLRRLEMGINSLVTANLTAKVSGTDIFNQLTLASMMYNVGFTAGTSLGYTNISTLLSDIYSITDISSASTTVQKLIRRVVPTLYGGTAVSAAKDALFRGARATEVSISDLITGDLIIVNNGTDTKLYIVYRNTLVYLGANEVVRNIDPASVLPTLTSSDKYVVLRPSIDYNINFSLQDDEYFNEADMSDYTDMEKALIATAEAYVLRGDRCQYTDDMTGKSINRAESGYKNPEDYTTDQYGYTNCANFTYDVHVMTHGYKPSGKQTDGSTKNLTTTTYNESYAKKYWNTSTNTSSSAGVILYVEPMQKDANGTYVSTLDDAAKAALKEQIISVLRPGDIINICRTAGTGHALMYIGNGMIIHSTGSSYSTANKTDTHEASPRFRMVEDLFTPSVYNETSYVFNLVSFAILRFQNLTENTVTENALNRLNNMQGVIAEKISSTAMGKTVNCGDTITYTFDIFNTNTYEKSFEIKDQLSEYVTFVSSDTRYTISGADLTWNIVVPAETKVSVSYTVRVNNGVATYTAIDGTKATINGVSHKCINTYVANTLTTEQQQQIIDAVNAVKASDVSGLTSIQILNKIYNTAFGVDNIFGENVTTEANLIGNITQTSGKNNIGIFNDTTYWSTAGYVALMDSNTSPASMMVAPGMYGGHYVYNSTKSGEEFTRYQTSAGGRLRSRYFWEKDLVVGDIFMMRGGTTMYLYIYVGNDTLVRVNTTSTFSTYSVSTRFQYAPHSDWRYLAVLRPSMVLDI